MPDSAPILEEIEFRRATTLVNCETKTGFHYGAITYHRAKIRQVRNMLTAV